TSARPRTAPLPRRCSRSTRRAFWTARTGMGMPERRKTMSEQETMTRRDREDLAKLIRREEKLAKEGIEQRGAELLADFTRQLHTVYDPFDERWRVITERVQKQIDQGNAELAALKKEIGLPDKGGGGYSWFWSSRGETGSSERRSELRAV